MKHSFVLASLFCIVLLQSSCTYLQWRNSDIEIKEKFESLEVSSEISYFEVDSLNLTVRTQSVVSHEEKVNLVFFHGSPSSLSAWDGYLLDSTLRKYANMYAIDRPGYGYSNFGEELTSIDTQAQIMDAIIKQKNLENVIAIGSSYGGPLAARVGFLNPNVKVIVMISPAIDPNNEKDIWGSRLTQWKLTRWLVPTSYRVAGDEKTVHADELAIIEPDWKSITVPVIHFHGDNDDVVPYENIEFSRENFQNIALITMADRGHEIAWKNPELIIPYLLEQIDQLQISK